MTTQAEPFASVWLRQLGAFCLVTSAVGIAAGVSALTRLTVTDVFNVAVARTWSETIATGVFMTPIISILTALEVMWVMSPAQLVQSVISWKLGQQWYFFAACVPMLTVITFATYDYLTPDLTFGINSNGDWEPWVHGLTLKRYLITLIFQLPVSTYTALHTQRLSTGRDRRLTFAAPFFVAVAIGIIGGCYLGERDLNTPTACTKPEGTCAPNG